MPRRRGKESRAEKVFKEIMAENFLHLGGGGGEVRRTSQNWRFKKLTESQVR